jgi:hypothetical protein
MGHEQSAGMSRRSIYLVLVGWTVTDGSIERVDIAVQQPSVRE